MKKVRRTVMLDAELDRAVRARFGDDLSAHLTRLLERELRQDRDDEERRQQALAKLVEDMEREFGPIPPEEQERVRAGLAELDRQLAEELGR